MTKYLTKMIDNSDTIFLIWSKLKAPLIGYSLHQFANSNLWVLKTVDNRFGFVLTDIFNRNELKQYKNFELSFQEKLQSESKGLLKNCLIVISNLEIDHSLLADFINYFVNLKKTTPQFFTQRDVVRGFNEFEKIVSKNNEQVSEIIGIWGELYILNNLLGSIDRDIDRLDIINSWEGAEDRTITDFNFVSKKLKFEVKTTLRPFREHVVNGLAQLEKASDWAGYLISLCILNDPAGIHCCDLVRLVRNKIEGSVDLTELFERKLEVRGEDCFNDSHTFSINSQKPLTLYDFSMVPKPILVPGIGKIEWEMNLENIIALNLDTQIRVLNIFKSV